MLKKLRLIDFKSFADESVELAPLTLLVGANASGKSNFLDALRILQKLSKPLPLEVILEGGQHWQPDPGWPGIRGGTAEAARLGTSAFTIESAWDVLDQQLGPEPVSVLHMLSCRTMPSPRLEAERLVKGSGEPLFRAEARDDDNIVISLFGTPLFKEIGHSGPGGSVSPGLDQMLRVMLQSGISVPLQPAHYTSAFVTALERIESFDFYPDDMRSYGRAGAELGRLGSNLSGTLSDLCSNASEKQSLVEWLAELCAPELAGIDFIRVKELGDVMAVLVEKDGRRVTARSLSDGTLRFLGTLVALYGAKPGSVIAIEEIAEGLHPARVRVLMEWLQAACRERSIQIIATTHSPTALQWLDEESLGNVVLFARTPEHAGTVMRRLRDLPHFFDVVRRVGIHEMFTTSWLEMAL